MLKDISDYLIDEVDGEEDVLLGADGTTEEQAKQPLEVDEKMLQALDKIVLYLRIVHSFDFYGHIAYPNEDTLPNRFGFQNNVFHETIL